jgi:hypothetical protein
MSLKVIGAGFGRTGTLSLKLALEELGLGPCYHMIETIAHPAHDAMWLALAKGETSDWRPILAGYASIVDWPGLLIWRELAAVNPQAKIILTVRDPPTWYASAAATIFARMTDFASLRADPDAVDPVRRRHMEMVNTIVVEKTFRGSLERSHAIGVFNAHNDEVRRSVPPERLLVYESGEGWGPLCAFLGVPAPQAPFPKANTTAEFHSRFPIADKSGTL